MAVDPRITSAVNRPWRTSKFVQQRHSRSCLIVAVREIGIENSATFMPSVISPKIPRAARKFRLRPRLQGILYTNRASDNYKIPLSRHAPPLALKTAERDMDGCGRPRLNGFLPTRQGPLRHDH